MAAARVVGPGPLLCCWRSGALNIAHHPGGRRPAKPPNPSAPALDGSPRWAWPSRATVARSARRPVRGGAVHIWSRGDRATVAGLNRSEPARRRAAPGSRRGWENRRVPALAVFPRSAIPPPSSVGTATPNAAAPPIPCGRAGSMSRASSATRRPGAPRDWETFSSEPSFTSCWAPDRSYHIA